MSIPTKNDVAFSLNAYLIVFVASACGLVLEIVAGRLLAPTIGVSLYTWTTIIGVVLAGISIGSFTGGMVADRFPSSTTLGLVLLAGGIASMSVLPLVDVVSGAFSSLPVVAQIVFVTASLFFVPSLILGMVTPIVIKLNLKDLANTGNVVGRTYAISAAGSIFGTFITGFVLIQWVGSRYTLILVAVTLVALALLFGNLWQRKSFSLGALVVLLGLGAAGFTTGALDSGCVRESNYFCIDVGETTVDGGRKLKTLHLDKLLHSYVDLDDPTYLAYGYEKIFGEIANHVAEQDSGFRALFIGGGGYTMPRNLEVLYPESTLEVIEIDPEVTKVAFDFLGLRADTRIVTYNEDARIAVPKLPDGQYDLIFGDAFNDVSVPYHLTTEEFNQEVKRLLDADGIYAINVIDKLQSGRFLPAFVNTLERTFPNVILISESPLWESDRRRTFVVVGSLQPLSYASAQSAGLLSGQGGVIGHIMPQDTFDVWITPKRKILLSDDYAPVDNLIAPIFLASSRLSDAEEYNNSGAEFQQQGRYEDAIAEYDEAIRLDPDYAVVYDNRGQSYAQLGEFQLAINDYDQAIRLDPKRYQAFNNRGSSFKNLGQLQSAIQDFDRAISLNPGHVRAYINRGIAYALLGRYQQSLQDFGQAILFDPGSALAYRYRGTSYLNLGQFQQAVQDFNRSIDIDPSDAETHNNRGNAYASLGQFQQAILDYGEVVKLDTQHAPAYNNRGTAYVNLGEFRLAVQDYDVALRLEPQNAGAYNNRGTAYRGLGQFERGIQDFDSAIRLDPDYAAAFANRALNFTHLHLDLEAERDLERAIELGFPRGLLLSEIEAIKAQR